MITGRLAVRPAKVDDLSAIVELRLALLGEHRQFPLYADLRSDVRARAFELYYNQLTAPHETMFLAERGERAIGLLRCVDSPSSPLLLPERYCYISSVYVVPDERRRGVLRALLRAAERWCAERGIDEMRLHNAASAPAARVWTALGFEIVEEVRRRVLPRSKPRRGPTAEPLAHAQSR